MGQQQSSSRPMKRQGGQQKLTERPTLQNELNDNLGKSMDIGPLGAALIHAVRELHRAGKAHCGLTPGHIWWDGQQVTLLDANAACCRTCAPTHQYPQHVRDDWTNVGEILLAALTGFPMGDVQTRLNSDAGSLFEYLQQEYQERSHQLDVLHGIVIDKYIIDEDQIYRDWTQRSPSLSYRS